MATYTSYGQRKALGRRYSIDPAYLLEADRLLNEYSLAPGRESRAQQESQFGRSLAFQAEQADLNRAQQAEDRQAQATAGMIGTGANLLTTAATIRALTMGKGEPFFGGLFGGGAPQTVSGPSTKMVGTQLPQMPKAISPATVDNAMLAASEATAGGIGAAPAIGSTFSAPNLGLMPATQTPQIPGAAAAAGGKTATAGVSSYAGPAAAAYLGMRLTGNALDETKEVPREVVTSLKYPITGAPSVAGDTISDILGINEIGKVTGALKSGESAIQKVFGGGK